MTIGCALLGCGVIAPTHVAALGLDTRARLRWACDTDLDVARRLGVGAVTDDWRRVLDDPAVDLVVVALPHHLHERAVLDALAAGKHVWCEKPLGITHHQLDRLCSAVPAGRVASGVFQHRFDPLVTRLHARVTAGDFGPCTGLSAWFRCTRTAAYYRSGPWRGTWEGEGGALLINQAIHTIDLGLLLSGQTAQAVRGSVRRTRDLGIAAEDTALLEADLSGGGRFTIDAANDGLTAWDLRLELTYALGRVVLGKDEALLELEHPNAALVAELRSLSRLPVAAAMPGKADYGHHHALQAADVLNAIAAGRAPTVSFASAAPANRLVLDAYRLFTPG